MIATKTHKTELQWYRFGVNWSGKVVVINVAVLGMAVAGDESQYLVADELGVVHSIVILHGNERETHWTSPPDGAGVVEQIEAALWELHDKE